jgi:hypothetical protein
MSGSDSIPKPSRKKNSHHFLPGSPKRFKHRLIVVINVLDSIGNYGITANSAVFLAHNFLKFSFKLFPVIIPFFSENSSSIVDSEANGDFRTGYQFGILKIILVKPDKTVTVPYSFFASPHLLGATVIPMEHLDVLSVSSPLHPTMYAFIAMEK